VALAALEAFRLQTCAAGTPSGRLVRVEGLAERNGIDAAGQMQCNETTFARSRRVARWVDGARLERARISVVAHALSAGLHHIAKSECILTTE
jgi:hypothetical protein